MDVVVLVGVDDLLPVRGYLGVRRLSAEVVLESVFGDVPEVVAPLHHDARGFGGCRCRRSRVGRRDRGRGIAGRVDGEQEDPAGVEGVVAGCDDGAIGKGASRVEVEDLLPPEPVAQCAFSDGPVAVVALHGDGRMSGRRCGNRGGVGEANEPDLVPVSAVQERVLDGRCGVDDRFGDDRYRLGRSGIFLTVLAVVTGMLDNVLRPILIRMGADLPMLLIFAGVIGGILAFGLVGIFIGPVVLAVTYTLLQSWVSDDA